MGGREIDTYAKRRSCSAFPHHAAKAILFSLVPPSLDSSPPTRESKQSRGGREYPRRKKRTSLPPPKDSREGKGAMLCLLSRARERGTRENKTLSRCPLLRALVPEGEHYHVPVVVTRPAVRRCPR